ncbi:Transglutaminase-like protein [Macrophomina phaseolina MS6]|uniref:Transglutaminase-like protein n=1 Tax=Macrophomina phaseolina (strain MS6) TaxID=1126212 RepID=K2S058_MACPH|nr:Transglutaminase-like protein [Macrophomina phaseolina MS6]
MVGRCERSARPTVFFCGPDAAARKRVRRDIVDSGILAQYPGFVTADSARPPQFDEVRRVASGEEASPAGVLGASPTCGNPMGAAVRVRRVGRGGEVALATATVGAVYRLGEELFFATAAHAFVEQDAGGNVESHGDFEFDGDFDDEEDSESGPDFISEPGADGDEEENSDHVQAASANDLDLQILTATAEPRGPISSDAVLAFQAEDIVVSSIDGPHPGLDYCLIRLKQDDPRIFGDMSALNGACNIHTIHPSCVASAPHDGTVIAYTGSKKAFSGTMSGTPSFLTLPGGQISQELWTVQLDGALADGDCGSVIIDDITGEIGGHIIAGSPATGTAFIVPAHLVFDDLRTRLGRETALAQRFEKCQAETSSGPMDARRAKMLTTRFHKMLSARRIEKLRNRLRSNLQASRDDDGGPHPSSLPPSYAAADRGIPLVPTQPWDARSIRFRKMLVSLSSVPTSWENPGLLDEALTLAPLDQLYAEAEEESQVFLAEAQSLGTGKKPAWGFQDCLIRAVMRWFKRSFFSWVNNPVCVRCGSPTLAVGMTAPLPDEAARGATQVELYRCCHDACGSYERFPRYNDAFVLVQTRRGRCGEWTNCFSMLCRAFGSRVRWVWSSEDHVWTEVYSTHCERWVHVDACEEAWDEPRIYTERWGKKLAYCIAFSTDGAADVTRRYVRSAGFALERTRAFESDLLHIINEIRSMRRKSLPLVDKFRLEKEDAGEDRELQRYVALQIAHEFCKIDVANPSFHSSKPLSTDSVKTREGRVSGNAEWVRARGERPFEGI